MKEKKWIAVLLTLAMVLSLSACQKKVNFTTDKLNVWIWDESQQEALETLAAPWAEKNHIEVEITAKSRNEYWRDIKSGLLPDLMWVDDSHLTSLAESGVLLQLDEQVEGSRALGMKDFHEQTKALFQNGGHTYAVPREEQVTALWYNKALFDSMQLSYPDETWTWEQVKEAAVKLTNRHNGCYGIVIPTGDLGNGWYNLVYAWGGSILRTDENGNTVSGWQDEGTLAAMNLLGGMIADAMPSQHTMETLGAAELFANGDAGMILQNRAQAEELVRRTGSGQWACTLLPYCDLDGNGECGEGERAAVLEGSGWAISARSTDTNAAFYLLETLGGSAARKTLSAGEAPEETKPENGEEEAPDPLAAYDQMLAQAVLIPMPRQTSGESWEEHAVETTMYTAWNDPSRMEAMLRQQHSYTQAELENRTSSEQETEPQTSK